MSLPPADNPQIGQQQRCREFLAGQGFLPVSQDSYPVFKAYDSGSCQFHELTATVSTIWAFGFDPLYKIIDNFLCSVWFYKSGPVYFYIQRPSAGTGGGALRHLVNELLALARSAGLPLLQIWAVDDTLLDELRAGAQAASTPESTDYRVSAECSEDYSEYLYRVADIQEWNGGINLNKRNSLKRCFNTPDVLLKPLGKDNFSVCFEIEDEWCSHQDCDACRAFAGCAKDSLKNMEEIFNP
ncbi:MAG: hypothetical protein LBT39_06980, partial [Treponema sp.]|nr:hypothetical protein [Treponema sp.]